VAQEAFRVAAAVLVAVPVQAAALVHQVVVPLVMAPARLPEEHKWLMVRVKAQVSRAAGNLAAHLHKDQQEHRVRVLRQMLVGSQVAVLGQVDHKVLETILVDLQVAAPVLILLPAVVLLAAQVAVHLVMVLAVAALAGQCSPMVGRLVEANPLDKGQVRKVTHHLVKPVATLVDFLEVPLEPLQVEVMMVHKHKLLVINKQVIALQVMEVQFLVGAPLVVAVVMPHNWQRILKNRHRIIRNVGMKAKA
jgi:hypothetical protein